jgi:CheY-like chemotaxis protein
MQGSDDASKVITSLEEHPPSRHFAALEGARLRRGKSGERCSRLHTRQPYQGKLFHLGGVDVRPILVIEDDDDSRVMLTALLTLHGYEVVAAANGAQGLVMARQRLPGLILLDLMMPVMDGLSFRAKQLADPTLSSIPVMIVSGQHNGRELAHDLAAVEFIAKPVAIDPLLDTLRAHYDASAARGHLRGS